MSRYKTFLALSGWFVIGLFAWYTLGNSATVTHSGTLPDSANKADFYALIDGATVTGIVNADVSASAAIADSKLALTTVVKLTSNQTIADIKNFTSSPLVPEPTNNTQAASKYYVDNSTLSKSGSLTRNFETANGTVAYTGVGFTPKKITFYASDSSRTSWGFTDSSMSDYCIYRDVFNVTRTYIGGSIVAYFGSGNTSVGDVVALNSDGFNITWTEEGSQTGNMTVIYIADR